MSARDEYQKNSIAEKDRNPDPTFGESSGVSWCLQPFKSGGGYAVAWSERQLSPGRREFVFTVDYTATGTPAAAKAIADVGTTLKADFNAVVQTHRDWWHAFYPGSFLSVPDTRMESFY